MSRELVIKKSELDEFSKNWLQFLLKDKVVFNMKTVNMNGLRERK